MSSATPVRDTVDHYEVMGGLIEEVMGGSINVGHWHGDDDETPLLEAINQLTDVVGEKLQLRPGERVPAIRLAQRVEAHFTGTRSAT